MMKCMKKGVTKGKVCCSVFLFCNIFNARLPNHRQCGIVHVVFGKHLSFFQSAWNCSRLPANGQYCFCLPVLSFPSAQMESLITDEKIEHCIVWTETPSQRLSGKTSKQLYRQMLGGVTKHPHAVWAVQRLVRFN